MKKSLPDKKLWEELDVLNQKHHHELSEEEKKNVATCDGIKQSHICKKPVYRCSECGNYGCDQEVLDKCSKQGFKDWKCTHCGVVGHIYPVMKKELEGIMQIWEKNDI